MQNKTNLTKESISLTNNSTSIFFKHLKEICLEEGLDFKKIVKAKLPPEQGGVS